MDFSVRTIHSIFLAEFPHKCTAQQSPASHPKKSRGHHPEGREAREPWVVLQGLQAPVGWEVEKQQRELKEAAPGTHRAIKHLFKHCSTSFICCLMFSHLVVV